MGILLVLALGKPKFIIVRVDYFTKWIKEEFVSKITEDMVQHFYSHKIICGFGIPVVIISNNGTQFPSSYVVHFGSTWEYK